MKKKDLLNNLSRVAAVLVDNEFVNCDVVIEKERICLCNWFHGMVTTVALRSIADVCSQNNLCYYVDFEFKDVTIHG